MIHARTVVNGSETAIVVSLMYAMTNSITIRKVIYV